jgi:hypothetical protein
VSKRLMWMKMTMPVSWLPRARWKKRRRKGSEFDRPGEAEAMQMVSELGWSWTQREDLNVILMVLVELRVSLDHRS